MQTLYSSNTTFHPAMMNPGPMRLKWLTFENNAAAEHQRRFRCPAHEDELAIMRKPLTAKVAYQWLGLMLGAAPPAAIFARMFQYGFRDGFMDVSGGGFFLLLLMMNAVCALMGFLMGRVNAGSALTAVRCSRTKMVFLLALLGAIWGVTTGGTGGVFFFGAGAIAGALFAAPIGIVAFVVFGALHRWLERGGMIDARQFWPLAVGIVATITTLIATF